MVDAACAGGRFFHLTDAVGPYACGCNRRLPITMKPCITKNVHLVERPAMTFLQAGGGAQNEGIAVSRDVESTGTILSGLGNRDMVHLRINPA